MKKKIQETAFKNPTKNPRARVRAKEKAGAKPSSAVINALRDAITSDDLQMVLKVWRDAMVSTTERWDGQTQQWVVLPDTRSRIEASKLFAAYKDGLPHQTQLVLNTSFRDLGSVLAKFKDSPEAMRVLRSIPGVEIPAIQETGAEKAADDSLQKTPDC